MPVKQQQIHPKEITFISKKYAQDGSHVFLWQGKLMRGIEAAQTQRFKALFDSGLLAKLEAENLTPKTTITSYKTAQFDMVLEHEKIEPMFYPSYWPFSMFKEAALVTIKVNQIARQYGYETYDAHPMNIVFKQNRPLFVDIASFKKRRKGFKGWYGYKNFIKAFYYPLRFFSQGHFYFARSFLNQIKWQGKMPHYAYRHYRNPLLSLLRADQVEHLFEAYYRFRNISAFEQAEVRRRAPKQIKKPLLWAYTNKLLPLQHLSLQRLYKKIDKLSLQGAKTSWSEYYNRMLPKHSGKSFPDRYVKLIDIINTQKPRKVLEFAGNRGLFAKTLLQYSKVKSVISTDYDEVAVSAMYEDFRHTDMLVMPAILDFIRLALTPHAERPFTSYKPDLVVMLAASHHLMLTQKLPLYRILEVMYHYTTGWVLIEFMPLGLKSKGSKYEAPPLPEWYTQSWFKETFSRYFHILEMKDISHNRIVFFGEKRKAIQHPTG